MKIIVLVLSLLSIPAFAAESSLRLEPGACDMLVKHTPSPNASFQPGLDAYGRSVAPADTTAQTVPLAPIEIPLTVDLANRLRLPAGAASGTSDSQIGPGGALGRYGNEGYIGTVTVLGDTVLLNGEPLTDETEANLAVLCMRANPPQ